MKWFLKVLIDNYANFSGRARRKEYWMFALFQIIIFIIIIFLGNFINDLFDIEIFNISFLIYFLATLIPWFAVNVRRLHDTGKSGGYLFINFIPLVGRIWYIVLMASEGGIEANKYGLNPKAPNFSEIEEIGKDL
ncbi:hypothetical protein A8C32_07720 [Flavivirga aquatica]|uniref:DUF805 domain-containing protein n=1 Tax=Flavivirga aquatica TaxID=1849968 RepID=A0A1E5SJ30_9FLAO|nr:DUF805 domain-containing protein [Flavivirga aquatica]OEJ99056.1 hypothetical protein A8C32_07720 [Flavivirga aquatica]